RTNPRLCPQTRLTEDIPLARPLLLHARRHHHDHRLFTVRLPNDGRRYGKRDEGLSHADLVRQDDPRLVVEAPQDLCSSIHLTLCVLATNPSLADRHLACETPIHSVASASAPLTYAASRRSRGSSRRARSRTSSSAFL